MRAALNFELRKALGSPVVPLVVLLCVVFAAGLSFLTGNGMMSQIEYGIEGRSAEEFEDLTRYYLYSFAGRSAYFGTFLIGVLIATSDQANGLLAKTVILFKSRPRVTLAKMLAVVLISCVTAVLAVGLSFGITYFIISGESAFGTAAITSHQWMIGLRSLLTFIVWGLIGFGMGLIVRNQVAAVIIVFMFTLFLEPMLTSLSNDNSNFAAFGKFLPGTVNWAILWPVDATGSDSAMGGLGGESLQVGPAIAVLIGYAAVLVGLGYWLGVRKRRIVA